MAAPAPTGARVDEVIDPDGGVRLYRLVGRVSDDTVADLDLRTRTTRPNTVVHLDLADAVIDSSVVMRGVEAIADRLEAAMVRVRVVGVDPNHPALRV